MTSKMNILLRSMALATLVMAGAANAQTSRDDAGATTLDQAVQQVQRETGGTVLSAEPRRFGRRMQYRIKVLAPDGHVRVISVAAGEPAGDPRQLNNRSRGNARGHEH